MENVIKILTEKIKLNNDILMPMIGFGTYKIANTLEGKDAILEALHQGYRHIDTAKIYDNEEIVGLAIKESNIPREEIFITTKIWGNELSQEAYLNEINNSLKRLNVEYIDLFLIHWPWKNRHLAWKALEQCYKEKKIKAIGVSNFTISHLEELKKIAEVLPVVNQIEFHPSWNQKELRNYHKRNNIVTIGWGTLKYSEQLEPKINIIAKKYNKTLQQLLLRWAYQLQVLIIPKSMHKERMIENSLIGDFIISETDMEIINTMTQQRFGQDPNNFNFE